MMKSTGMVRQIDKLGRIVIPIEIRNTQDIKEDDPLEIFIDGDKIILKKYMPACLFCGNAENTLTFRDKLVCRDCLEKLKAQL